MYYATVLKAAVIENNCKKQIKNRLSLKKNKTDQILQIKSPENALPVVFDSPHSGRIYPPDYNFSCDFKALERIEDRYVDELFDQAPAYGASLLCALFPRTYLDVNRAIDDIDDLLLDAPWPTDQFGPIKPTSRSDAGIGLISRLIRPGIPIYNHALTPEAIIQRIKSCYVPYYAALEHLLEEAAYKYGQFWHINCHSMPEGSAYPKRNLMLVGNMQKPSDIVLGDLDGQTCGRDFIFALRDFFRAQGLRVTVNDPFKGVELIRKYSQPTRGKNALQIEINRSLYMNEETGEKNAGFAQTKAMCTALIQFTTHFAKSKLTSIAAD